MKTVAFVSFKGGAGKTTAAMAACSAYVGAGSRVAMIDADENFPLVAWRDRATAHGLWSEQCTVERGDDVVSLESALSGATDCGADIAIIDTRGGGSELNNTIVCNVDAVIVPTALTGLDISAALSTFEYAVQLLHDAGVATPVRLLVQRAPVGRLTSSQAQDLEALSTLPRCETVLHARDAFGAFSKRGMLHLLVARAEHDPRTRLTATHLRVAMEEAERLGTELRDLLGGSR